jgi:hypothetical protein
VEGEEVYSRILAVLWRGGAVIPAASAAGEELGYLTDHRVFACLSGNCDYRKSLETES